MILKDVELIGGEAVAGGGYGDVWKGSLQGKLLAVKVVRAYQKSDVIKLLKVQFLPLWRLAAKLKCCSNY
jgi:hypothetical protein